MNDILDDLSRLRASAIVAQLESPAGREDYMERVLSLADLIGLDAARVVGEATQTRVIELLRLFGDEVVPPSLLGALFHGIHDWADLEFNLTELAEVWRREHPPVEPEGWDYARGNGAPLMLQSTEHVYDVTSRVAHTRRRYVLSREEL